MKVTFEAREKSFEKSVFWEMDGWYKRRRVMSKDGEMGSEGGER